MSLPQSDLNQWYDAAAEWGGSSVFLILFPEISRMFVSSLTVDNLTPVAVTSGLGWALLIIWSLVMISVIIAYLV